MSTSSPSASKLESSKGGRVPRNYEHILTPHFREPKFFEIGYTGDDTFDDQHPDYEVCCGCCHSKVILPDLLFYTFIVQNSGRVLSIVNLLGNGSAALLMFSLLHISIFVVLCISLICNCFYIVGSFLGRSKLMIPHLLFSEFREPGFFEIGYTGDDSFDQYHIDYEVCFGCCHTERSGKVLAVINMIIFLLGLTWQIVEHDISGIVGMSVYFTISILLIIGVFARKPNLILVFVYSCGIGACIQIYDLVSKGIRLSRRLNVTSESMGIRLLMDMLAMIVMALSIGLSLWFMWTMYIHHCYVKDRPKTISWDPEQSCPDMQDLHRSAAFPYRVLSVGIADSARSYLHTPPMFIVYLLLFGVASATFTEPLNVHVVSSSENTTFVEKVIAQEFNSSSLVGQVRFHRNVDVCKLMQEIGLLIVVSLQKVRCLAENSRPQTGIVEVVRTTNGAVLSRWIDDKFSEITVIGDERSVQNAIRLTFTQLTMNSDIQLLRDEVVPEKANKCCSGNLIIIPVLGILLLLVLVVGVALGLLICKNQKNHRVIEQLEQEASEQSVELDRSVRTEGGISPPVCFKERGIVEALGRGMYNGSEISHSHLFDEQIPFSAAEFKKCMDTLVDFAVDYLEKPELYAVSTKEKPGFLWKKQPFEGPEEPVPFANILCDVYDVILPGLTHWQHPRFHAYFMTGCTFPDILAETLTSCFAIGSFSWEACPAATELEITMVNWMGRAIGLPESFLFTGKASYKSPGGGAIQPSSSDAIFLSVLASRNKKIRELVDENLDEGLRREKEAEVLSKLVAYASKEAHSSIEKACKMAMVCMRAIESDSKFAMRGDALNVQIEKDIKKGLIPFHVHATSGTTAIVSFDNLEEIAEVAAKHKLWMHVDGAYGGASWMCEEFRDLRMGVEKAHSINISNHKFLLQSPAIAYFWTRDQMSMRKAFQTGIGEVETTNFSDWGVQVSRRSRVFKTWFVMQMYGLDGIRKYIHRIISLANLFHKHIKTDDRLEVVAEPNLGLVAFKVKDSSPEAANAKTARLCEYINRSRKILITHANPKNTDIVRISVNSERSTPEDIEESWALLKGLIDEFMLQDDLNFSRIENQYRLDGNILGYHTPQTSIRRSISQSFISFDPSSTRSFSSVSGALCNKSI
ncbi:hypothetical protein QR680_018465 [Steinernema hermaphroditum]|uniref:Uncharacterized protein n=1 Tax=Steinernema hermaphroditum TaxID=289476 RepID=A0AA39LQD4_9BILA|nr:hypothetical protein QR680_018465 [Steinernema hermaphroditum]